MQKNYPLEGVLKFRCADFDKPRAGINFQSKAPFTSFFFSISLFIFLNSSPRTVFSLPYSSRFFRVAG